MAKPVGQGASSQADLLGNTLSTGYLLNSSQQQNRRGSTSPADASQGQVKSKSSRSKTDAIAKPSPSSSNNVSQSEKSKPQSSAIASLTESTGSPSAVYSLTGAMGQRTSSSEAELITALNQALGFGGALGTPQVLHVSGPVRILSAETPKQSVDLPIIPVDGGGSPAKPDILPPPPTSPTVPAKPPTPSQTAAPANPPGTAGVVELTADYQEYDELHQIFTAEGHVLMRFQGALLDADRLQVNLNNRLAVAEGNVALTRGKQVLRGQRFAYNFVQGSGTVLNARGEIYLSRTSTDFGSSLGSDASKGTILGRPISDRITSNQPTQNVTSPGGLVISTGAGRDVNRVQSTLPAGGSVRHLRFEAERLDFTPAGWEAANIQITNDPFSPPELVLKADRAKLTRLSPLQDEIRATNPRLVFDQGLSIPLLVSRTVLDRRQRQPPLVRFGYDSTERGGLFVEKPIDVIISDTVQLSLTPQIFLQRAFFSGNGIFSASNIGLRAKLNANLGPRTSIVGITDITSFDPATITDKLRVNLQARQLIGTHTLALEYSYRDRLFNGSLGFQTVQSSLGVLLTSPVIHLGQTGINLSYQGSFQNIDADTDRKDLLAPIRDNNRINLSRYQGAVALSRGFSLWRGKPLPATPTEGLRYTPVPLVPYVGLNAGMTGVISGYSSGDSQENLIASVGLSAQFGHFSRSFFDYTGLNIAYTQVIGTGQSPFLFDRAVDVHVLSLGITQQVYGPFRIGFQTAINLDSSQQISTDYILEYSRRSYGVILRYNPVLAIGSLGLRISDFNWTGGTEPFEGSGVTPVEGGIRRTSD
jgi:hypothetical protein